MKLLRPTDDTDDQQAALLQLHSLIDKGVNQTDSMRRES